MKVFSQGAGTVNAMRETYPQSGNHAAATNAESCENKFGRCAYRAVMRAAQGFFETEKRCATKELELRSGHHIRTVQMWFADKHQGSATALIALLATDAAPVVLATMLIRLTHTPTRAR